MLIKAQNFKNLQMYPVKIFKEWGKSHPAVPSSSAQNLKITAGNLLHLHRIRLHLQVFSISGVPTVSVAFLPYVFRRKSGVN